MSQQVKTINLLESFRLQCTFVNNAFPRLTVTTEAFAPVNISVAPSSEHHPNLSLNIVTLWLWVGADVGEKHSIRLEVPANTSLFECMQLAAERDPHFR